MDTKAKVESEAAIAGQQSSVNRKTGRAKRATASSSPKGAKGARRSSRSSRTSSGTLVCRYCGSDDLAPSFKERRDARCRACFKKRYGTNSKVQKSKRVGKAKASK